MGFKKWCKKCKHLAKDDRCNFAERVVNPEWKFEVCGGYRIK